MYGGLLIYFRCSHFSQDINKESCDVPNTCSPEHSLGSEPTPPPGGGRGGPGSGAERPNRRAPYSAVAEPPNRQGLAARFPEPRPLAAVPPACRSPPSLLLLLPFAPPPPLGSGACETEKLGQK